ncbi:MAG TPA: ABC transporter ATP-binding protein [Allosphingosinicella sp.]
MSGLVEATGLALPGRLKETGLTLRPGELTCLVGPNGSGKTSLLHALAGVGNPEGSVLVAGTDPRGLPPARRQQLLSYLPASRDIGWPLTARDLVALGTPAGGSEGEVRQVLADLGLAEFADRRIDRMSTGERSRVLIARALVAKPKLLLLDEPASNLDPYWQLRLMDFLRASASANAQAMLVAVHDLELARNYADRLIIMHEGRIEADGDPEALLSGELIPQIFNIEWSDGRWRPSARRERPQSSR